MDDHPRNASTPEDVAANNVRVEGVLGSMTAEYNCPFPDCGAEIRCHPHEFDARLQAHLDAEHGGYTVVQLRDEVAKAQGPA